jgi:glycosyltransferase involved in cell wall biosynthesis
VEQPASVIIPAHNEAASLPRLLERLGGAPDLEVHVVCNGCTDGTADVARGFSVVVHETPEPSKTAALRLGFEHATPGPVVLVDADVLLDAEGIRRLVSALRDDVRLAGPVRRLDSARSTWPVRAYFRLWEALPGVASSLAGRGVQALSPAAVERVRAIPDVVADDLWVHRQFTAAERRIVPEVTVTVVTPRTVRDLVRRRVRVDRGVAGVEELLGSDPSLRTSRSELVRTAMHPRRVLGLPVFVAVRLLSRREARRLTGSDAWIRDDSSRRPNG